MRAHMDVLEAKLSDLMRAAVAATRAQGESKSANEKERRALEEILRQFGYSKDSARMGADRILRNTY